MSDLTSCYFCGTALDAPVERYPLTPPSIDATTGRSVALCPTCRRKLVKVLEIVGEEFDAVAADADDDTETADEDTATDDAESGEPQASAETEAGTVAADEPADPTDAAAEQAGPADAEAEADPTDETEEPFEPAVEVRENDPESADDDTGDDTSAEDSAEADSPAEPSKSTDVDPVAATDPTAGDGGATTDTGTAEAAGDESDTGTDDGGKPDILSTPAAQKVIKLLQNREFPLEREEFEIVASNAYDIPMQDCEEVIDTLVAEGYVAEDGAMLTRPE